MRNLEELRGHFTTCVGYDGQGHWMSSQPIARDEYFGFIYCLSNSVSGSLYIGSKQFHTERTLPPLKGKKRKRKVIQESDWRDYKSSSKVVYKMMLEDPDNWEYYHLHSWKSKRTLKNAEQMTMHNMDFLTRMNEVQPEYRMFLNQWSDRTFACSKKEDFEELSKVFG